MGKYRFGRTLPLGSIDLGCGACGMGIKQLHCESLYRSRENGTPVVPTRCLRCKVVFSASCLERFRKVAEEHAQFGPPTRIYFTMTAD